MSISNSNCWKACTSIGKSPLNGLNPIKNISFLTLCADTVEMYVVRHEDILSNISSAGNSLWQTTLRNWYQSSYFTWNRLPNHLYALHFLPYCRHFLNLKIQTRYRTEAPVSKRIWFSCDFHSGFHRVFSHDHFRRNNTEYNLERWKGSCHNSVSRMRQHGQSLIICNSKVAMACLYTLFRNQLADQSCLFETAPEVPPIASIATRNHLNFFIRSFRYWNLFWMISMQILGIWCAWLSSTYSRHCQAVSEVQSFAMLRIGIYLTLAWPVEEPVHQLYSDLLKRLDDSSDIVRKAACKTFIAFFQASPPEYFAGTIIDYILNNLFIHLDDPDENIQSAIFQVLQHATRINAALVMEKAKENQSRHRSPHYCNQLIELIQN